MKIRSSLILFITFIAGVVVAAAVPVVAQQADAVPTVGQQTYAIPVISRDADSDYPWEIQISRPPVGNSTWFTITKLNKATGQTFIMSCHNFCKEGWREPSIRVKE